MTKSRYNTIENLFLTILRKENTNTTVFYNRWTQWKRRFEVYEGLTSERYIRFFQLQEDRKLISQENKLMDALRALNDLYDKKNNDLRTKYPDIEKIILQMVDMELSKIEIRQFLKLSKIQLLEREKLKEKREELRAKRVHMRSVIQTGLFSEKIKDKEKSAPHLLAFLKQQETKFHAGKHIERADYAASTAKGIGTGAFAFNFGNTIRSIFEPLAAPIINLGANLSAALTAIPIISSIVSAVPIIFNTWKAWFRNKSTTKKAIFTIAAIAAIAGIVLSIAFTGLGVLIVGGIIAAILAGIGFAAVMVFPLLLVGKQAKVIQAEIEAISRHAGSLHDLMKEKKALTSLTDSDKDMLLKRFEEIIVVEENPHDIKETKKLIIEGKDINALTANPIIKRILDKQDIKEFLYDENNNKLVFLKNHLTELQKTEREKRIVMINGACAVAGLVLLCIPTPATIIIGSMLIIVTCIAGLAIKYSWGEKIAGLFSRLRDKFFKPTPGTELEPFPKERPKVLPRSTPANDQEYQKTPQAERVASKEESEREKLDSTSTQRHQHH